MSKTVSGIMLILLLVGIFALEFNIQPVKAEGTIYIRADGSIDPPTAPISTVDKVTYTFTDNILNILVIYIERDNIVVDGADHILQGTGYGGMGMCLVGRSNVTIKKTTIKGFYSGIYLDQSLNNSISGNNITNNKYGIELRYSLNNTISGNNIANNLPGIMLSLSSNNNSIRENTFFNDGLWVLDSYRNVVVNNLVNDKPLVYLEDVSDYTVENAGQVILINCNNIIVENLNLSQTHVGVQLWGTDNTSISRNNITNNSYVGIFLVQSLNNSISGNNITNNFHSIYLGQSLNNSISGNNITANNFGMILAYSFNNSISGNNITADKYQGIFFTDYCENNSIFGNNIANNGYGIELWYSLNNKFYHNNFIDNIIQVRSLYTEFNLWDDDYPSGGNYWSDCTGVDLYHGSDQDITGSDGIVDTPYIIYENNRDNYPLMRPWTMGPHVNLAVKTFGIGEIEGVEAWIDNEQPTYCSPINMRIGIGQYTVKVDYGFLEDGPDEGSYIKYSFSHWEGGSTNNVRSLTLTKDKTIIAFYKWKIIYLW